MFSQRKPPAPEPSPRMRYYLSNLPTQLRSPEDFDRLSRLMGELPGYAERANVSQRGAPRETRVCQAVEGCVTQSVRAQGRAFLLPLPAQIFSQTKTRL